MSDFQITNCHLHTFTLDHMPEDYPYPIIGFLRRRPKIIRFAAWVAKAGGLFGKGEWSEQITRLGRMADAGRKPFQQNVLEQVLPQYPEGTRFVVLPMDVESAGFKPAPKSLRQQHDELADLARHAEYGKSVIPFAKVHPARADAFDEFRRCIEELGFKGLKIYPKLGYGPADPLLMDKVYPYCVDNNLPVMTHCSRGGVHPKGHPGEAAQMLGAPQNYIPVMERFPQLRICLAHFGGDAEWEVYNRGINPFSVGQRQGNWVARIYDMLKSGDYPNLYTDISYTMFDFADNIPALSIFLENETVRSRVLFGSDYYMTKQEDLTERQVSMRLRHALGTDVFRQIASENPDRWLNG